MSAKRAKVFRSGGSQAVRLPKEYRFEVKEVLIHREGGRIILEAERKGWSARFLELAGCAPDFPYPVDRRGAEPGPDLD